MEFSKLQICVDLFLFSAGYTDVATLVNLPKFTAGQLFYYPVSVTVNHIETSPAYVLYWYEVLRIQIYMSVR